MEESQQQQINSSKTTTTGQHTSEELDSLISAFASPIPDHILTDYDNKAKKKHMHRQMDNESALEHRELKGPVFREFTIHIFQSISFLQNMPPIDPIEIESRMIDLPHTKPHLKKTIIFDLDETLAHCVRQENPLRQPDVHLDIKLQSGKVLKAGFNVRPFTKECLEMVNQHFEVIVFTASHKWYADVILDYIDPEHKLIQHRVYRDNCIKTTDNVYIKDLRVFKNRQLKDMIIVDNAVFSFGAQLANGVPITPFKDDREDREFIYLMNYLDKLRLYEDMREFNREAFKMEQVYEIKLDPYIHYYDYQLCVDDKSDDDEYYNDGGSGSGMADRLDLSHVDNQSDKSHGWRGHPLTKALQAYYNNQQQQQQTTSESNKINEKDKLNSISYCQNMAAAIQQQSQNAPAEQLVVGGSGRVSSRRRTQRPLLPKSINNCLDEFKKKMVKTKNIHQKLLQKQVLPQQQPRALNH